MVAGHSQQVRPRAQARERFPDPLERLGEQPELGRRSRLRQVPGEQHKVPRSGDLREPLEILEELRAHRRHERRLLLHALVQVSQVQPAQRGRVRAIILRRVR
jgi:hypothetical protein